MAETEANPTAADGGSFVAGISTRDELAEKLRGQSDAEIVEFGRRTGVDALLDRAFAAFENRFHPERAGRKRATLRWRVTIGEEAWDYDIAVADGKCRVARSEGGDVDATITVEFATFCRILAGLASPMKSFMGGHIKVSGNVLTAVTTQKWFED